MQGLSTAAARRDMTTIYLVRHAHSHWQPDEDRPLSPEGMAQAVSVARILAEVRPAAVWSSPARRAVQTVMPLAKAVGLSVTLDSDLRERELSLPARVEFEDAVQATWLDFDFAFPGGESNGAASLRAVAAIRRIAAAGDVAVVSTHGNLLALVLAAIDPAIGFDFWRALSFPDIYKVDLVEPPGRSTFERVWPGAV